MSEPKDYEAMPLSEKLEHLAGKLDEAQAAQQAGADLWHYADADQVADVSTDLSTLSREVFKMERQGRISE